MMSAYEWFEQQAICDQTNLVKTLISKEGTGWEKKVVNTGAYTHPLTKEIFWSLEDLNAATEKISIQRDSCFDDLFELNERQLNMAVGAWAKAFQDQAKTIINKKKSLDLLLDQHSDYEWSHHIDCRWFLLRSNAVADCLEHCRQPIARFDGEIWWGRSTSNHSEEHFITKASSLKFQHLKEEWEIIHFVKERF